MHFISSGSGINIVVITTLIMSILPTADAPVLKILSQKLVLNWKLYDSCINWKFRNVYPNLDNISPMFRVSYWKGFALSYPQRNYLGGLEKIQNTLEWMCFLSTKHSIIFKSCPQTRHSRLQCVLKLSSRFHFSRWILHNFLIFIFLWIFLFSILKLNAMWFIYFR